MKNIFALAIALHFLLGINAQDSPKIQKYLKELPADSNSEFLKTRLSGMNDLHSFISFMSAHAASYSDFDSLYSLLQGEKCPVNFTFNLLHEKLPSYPLKINTEYLFFVYRNFESLQMSKTSEPGKEEFLLLGDWFKKYSEKIRDTADGDFRMETPVIRRVSTSFRVCDTSIVQKTGKGLKEQLSKNAGPIGRYYHNPDIIKIEDKGFKFELYEVSCQRPDFTASTDSKLEKGIIDYMKAQFFNDIIFFSLNGKLAWMDVSP